MYTIKELFKVAYFHDHNNHTLLFSNNAVEDTTILSTSFNKQEYMAPRFRPVYDQPLAIDDVQKTQFAANFHTGILLLTRISLTTLLDDIRRSHRQPKEEYLNNDWEHNTIRRSVSVWMGVCRAVDCSCPALSLQLSTESNDQLCGRHWEFGDAWKDRVLLNSNVTSSMTSISDSMHDDLTTRRHIYKKTTDFDWDHFGPAPLPKDSLNVIFFVMNSMSSPRPAPHL